MTEMKDLSNEQAELVEKIMEKSSQNWQARVDDVFKTV